MEPTSEEPPRIVPISEEVQHEGVLGSCFMFTQVLHILYGILVLPHLSSLVPNSFPISESFVQLSAEKGTASSEGVELPFEFPQWTLITIDCSIILYRLLIKGIPEGYPPSI